MNVFTSGADQRLKEKQPTNMESPSILFKKHPRMYFMTKGNVQNQNIRCFNVFNISHCTIPILPFVDSSVFNFVMITSVLFYM